MKNSIITTILSLFLIALAIIAFVKFTQQYGLTGAVAFQTNLTINASCGVGLNSTNLSFGQTNPNTTFDENNITLNFSNTGNTPQNVSINATPWFINNDTGALVEANSSTLNCNQTRYQNWSNSLLNWDQIGATGRGICSGSTLATINRIQENQSCLGCRAGENADNNTTFKVNVPAGVEPGKYVQNVTLFGEC